MTQIELSRRELLQAAVVAALPKPTSTEQPKTKEQELAYQLEGLEHNIVATIYDGHFVGLSPRKIAEVDRPATASLADAQAACGTDPAPSAISLKFPADRGDLVAVECDFTQPYNEHAQQVDFIGPIALRHYYFPNAMRAQIGNADTSDQVLLGKADTDPRVSVDDTANWSIILPKSSSQRIVVEPHPQGSDTEVLVAHTLAPALLYRGKQKPAETMRDFVNSYSNYYIAGAEKQGHQFNGTGMRIQVISESDTGWASQIVQVDYTVPGSFEALMPAIMPSMERYKPNK